MQALSQALAEFPDVNATLQSDMRAVIRHRHHNIGVAMATPTGLVVSPAKLILIAPSPTPCLRAAAESVPSQSCFERSCVGQLGLPSDQRQPQR